MPVDYRQLHYQVLNLYKTLLYYGRDYPLGYTYFRDRCHRAFQKNREERDVQQIQKAIQRGEFIIKELEALYRLKKYRYLKEKYYPDNTTSEVGADPKDMMRKLKEFDKKGNGNSGGSSTTTSTSFSNNSGSDNVNNTRQH